MRLYEVQPGDSPGSISIAFAECPKCSRDLIAANTHKPTVTYPNGYRTFQELRAGEKLVLPEKWFNGDLDARPPSYFAALPHPDGVTPSKLGVGAAGVLGDYAALDIASAKVNVLSALGDQPFSDAVNDTASAIDMSVREVDEGIGAPALYAAPYAQAARKNTGEARQRNVGLVTAISAGDQSAALQARIDILHDLSSALSSARLALQAFYGDPDQLPTAVVAAAKAAATAISADQNFCVSIAQRGSAVNTAVHAFKTAWNASNPGSPVPINTGTYEQATTDALARVLGTAPPACAPHVAPPPSSTPGSLTPPEETKLSVGAIMGLGLLGVGAVGSAIYFATRASAPQVRRVRPRIRRVGPGPILRPKRDDTIGPWKKDFS